jgi:UPF0716 protein FxsA
MALSRTSFLRWNAGRLERVEFRSYIGACGFRPKFSLRPPGEKSLFRYLPALILAFVVAEIVVFVAAIELFGGLAVLAAILVTGIAGSALLKRQGLKALSSLGSRPAGGQPNGFEAVFGGAWLALAGLLLIFPGFLADIAGLMLMIPPVRRYLTKRAGKWISIQPNPYATGARWGGPGPMIEGEAVEVPEEPEQRPLIR